MISQFIKHSPKSLIFLTTYKCTAACTNCCFACTPSRKEALSPERIKEYIIEAKAAFPSLGLAVFTGGECFLLGKDLPDVISAAKKAGYLTRCVTNGYWASSDEATSKIVTRLKEAGLDEINFSTGDEHQAFVSAENVARGVVNSCRSGIRTVVVVEGPKNARFSLNDFLGMKDVDQFLRTDSAAGLLTTISNIWIDFNAGPSCEKDQEGFTVKRDPGCTNILESVIIDPNEDLLACCGLTVNKIPEMNAGKVSPAGLAKAYSDLTQDFMRLWLRVDGPQKISEILGPDCIKGAVSDNSHPCETCRKIFNSLAAKKAIREQYAAHAPGVVFRYKFNCKLNARHDPSFLGGTSIKEKNICFGV